MTCWTVYMFFDAAQQPVYCGCSGQTGSRLRSHSNAEWWPEVAYAHFEHFESKRVALDRERDVIERLQPRYNRLFKEPRTAPLDLVPEAAA